MEAGVEHKSGLDRHMDTYKRLSQLDHYVMKDDDVLG